MHKLIYLGMLLPLAACDSGAWQYGESSKQYAERVLCEQDNRENEKVANTLASQGRYQEADIYVRTHPIQTCPKKP